MIFRYMIAGGTAAAFDLAFFLTFSTWLGYNYLVIGGVGFLIATAINYVISIRIVFESGVRLEKQQEIGAIYVVSGVGLLLHELILYWSVAAAGLEGFIGKIIATGSVFFWNFLLRKHYVFKKR